MPINTRFFVYAIFYKIILDLFIIIWYNVYAMHVDICYSKQRGKVYRSVLLRHSYREGKKIVHKTILNLSGFPEEEIMAIKYALKNKKEVNKLSSLEDEKIKSEQGLSVGAIILLKAIAERLNITKVLGKTKNGKLALWQIMSRVLNHGSRLSSVRLAGQHAICDLLNMDSFNEDDLYKNLEWISDNQMKLEKKLFDLRYKNSEAPKLFMYDVTSSYFEGTKNELANYGYNRDKKVGKVQIVIGLLTDNKGIPVSVEVFKGNSSDPKTVYNQVKKLSERFGVKEVTFVGDRGMIKTKQIDLLAEEHFNYITGITKPQIKTLIRKGYIQVDLFCDKICEIVKDDVRYILRRNPIRSEEIKSSRDKKIEKIQKKILELKEYLSNHKRAKVDVAVNKINKSIEKYNMSKFTELKIKKRTLTLQIDEKKMYEISELDGCYVLKTDLSKKKISAKNAHDRYKDLSKVEEGFRTMKTGLLETRPYFVRKEKSTRGHVFIVMLAYMIVQELKKLWSNIDITIEEGISELSCLSSLKISFGNSNNHRFFLLHNFMLPLIVYLNAACMVACLSNINYIIYY